MTYKYIGIIKSANKKLICNKVFNQRVGEIRDNCLFLYQGYGFTNGCIKEVLNFLGTKSSDRMKVYTNKGSYFIWSLTRKMYIAQFRRERMGTWMHWQLFGYKNVGIPKNSLKIISRFITSLYSKKKNK